MTEKNKAIQKGPSAARSILVPAGAGCGLGCLSVLAFGALAVYFGFCFIWRRATPNGAILCFIVVLTTAIVLRVRKRRTSWRLFMGEILLTAFLWVGYSAWNDPRELFKVCYLNPIPKSVEIHHACLIASFCPDTLAFFHFSAPPEVIASIIRSNNLTVVTNRDNDSHMDWGMSCKPDRWKPGRLSNPTLYSCMHASTSPWEVGIWVNDKTNEVFGYQF